MGAQKDTGHKHAGDPQVTAFEPEEPGSQRDPEERRVRCDSDGREKMLDKTLADTFPTSDPLSSIPDPCPEEESATKEAA